MASRPQLVIDSREPVGQKANGRRREDIRKHLDPYAVSYSVETLVAGDFKLWDDSDVCQFVTRKGSDYAESLFSGHFSEELAGIIADPDFVVQQGDSPRYSRIFFIMEGVWADLGGAIGYFKRVSGTYFRNTFTHNARLDTLLHANLSVSSAGIILVPTADLRATAGTLAALVDRAGRGWPTTVTKTSRRPQPKSTSDARVARLMGVWPRLREAQAVALLERWGTIWDVLGAARLGTVDTPGIGKASLANIQGVLNDTAT